MMTTLRGAVHPLAIKHPVVRRHSIEEIASRATPCLKSNSLNRNQKFISFLNCSSGQESSFSPEKAR